MFKSINPYTLEEVYSNVEFSNSDVERALVAADSYAKVWRSKDVSERSQLMLKLEALLLNRKEDLASVITAEMGKPLKQAIAEVEKCAKVCRYYAENAAGFLQTKLVDSNASRSYVRYDPLGVILGVMPWNYPFWQVFRFVVPTLMAGNVVILKHASNVMECARRIERLFHEADFDHGCYQNMPVRSDYIADIIIDERVKAVSLTGSGPAGSAVAAVAAKEIKKAVLELGGNNALVVFDDCDIEQAVKTCLDARFQNAGQSCIAGKRLLIQESIAEVFLNRMKEAILAMKTGDPMAEDTEMATMAREDLASELEKQLSESVAMGARVLAGGKRNRAFFEPTLLVDVRKDMPVFKEETFGPLLGVMTFSTDDEAVALVNDTAFGLGTSVFTSDIRRAERMINDLNDGAVFVNEKVLSDPRLPFGGTKSSGYGRELSVEGIHEFVNVKTVYIS